MKKRLFVLFVLAATCLQSRAQLTLTDWTPVFKGVDHAIGTNVPNGSTPIPTLQVVHIARVDLTDPDIQLFTDPRASGYVQEQRETISLSTSNFLQTYGVQVAIDANFYGPFSDPSSEGQSMEVFGLAISRGIVVSPQENSPDHQSLLFTTNNQPLFVFNNTAPGTNTSGIFTAVTGRYPLIINSVDVSDDANSPIRGLQPRTAYGVSQDNRYLYLMTIDGRQPGYSDGALDSQTVYWLQLIGAYNAINMDGGGSTTLNFADGCGNPYEVNHTSYIPLSGRQRFIGSHFGVYAQPLPQGQIRNLNVAPYDTTATLTWQTVNPSSARIDYGPTTGYGSSVSSATLLKNHAFTLNDLNAGSTYFYNITCNDGTTTSTFPCRFTTTNFATAVQIPIFDVTNKWRYTSNNLDGINWQAPGYDDSSWAGPGPGLLYVEDKATVTNRNTPLPTSNNTNGTPVSGLGVAPTYYFRTHFTFSGDPSKSVILNFTPYIDDAAAFYLNGVEIKRIRLTPAPALITYTAISDPPNIGPCGSNEATCPDPFSVSVNNILNGDNVLAVELHQAASNSNDAVFGTALTYSVPTVPKPRLNVILEGNTTTIYWNGSGYTLQQSSDLNGPWTDVPGPITSSTFVLNNPSGMKFFSLRQ